MHRTPLGRASSSGFGVALALHQPGTLGLGSFQVEMEKQTFLLSSSQEPGASPSLFQSSQPIGAMEPHFAESRSSEESHKKAPQQVSELMT